MAASDKNILISPQRGSTTNVPSIVLTGDGNDPLTISVLDGTPGSLSVEGSAGQLFSVTNNLTVGSIFSVNDVSGIPSLDIDADGTVSMGVFGGNVGIGTASPTTELQVVGTITATAFSGPLTGSAITATTLATPRAINGTNFDGSANITTANWGTARNLTIGSTAKSVNGSGNVSWTLAEIGVNNSTLTLAASGIATGSQTWTSNQGTNATFTVNVPATNLGITAGTTAGPIVTSSTGNNATLPSASATASGVVTTGAQTWAGVKTFNSTITGSISGNAGTATTWATGRTIALTGDVTGTSVAFNGSANLSFATTLINSGVTAGTYTSVTVDAKGRVTAGSSPATPSGALSNSTTSTQSGYFGNIFLFDDVSPSHYLGITNSADLTAARTLSLNVNNADRTISLSGNLTVSATATISGTNTGDQTITLTGDVTGTGTGSFATTLANSGVAASTYRSVTVDVKGRVTAGTNPTTLAGYGITDAVPSSRTLTIAGTTNQVTVSLAGAQNLTANRSWTLSLPQNIHTAATPTFGGLTVNGNLYVGSNTDLSTSTKNVTIESRGYAGLELLGDTANLSGEPGGAYILLAQDGARLGSGATDVKGMIGIVQGANQDGAGGTYTGTTANSVYFGHKHNSSLHLGTNSTVHFTINASGNVTSNGTLGIRAAASASVATQIPIFTADPAATTRTLVTRTPAQLRGDIGAVAKAGDTLTGFLTLHAAPTANLHAATKQYVDGILATNDAMVFKGTLGTGGTYTALPTTHGVGWTIRVITAGTYAGQVAEIGDMYVSLVTRAGSGNVNADWTLLQTNIDGAVVGPASATDNHVALFNGTSGKVIKSAGVVLGSGTLTLATSGIATGSQTFGANQNTAATFTVNVPATNLGITAGTTAGPIVTSSTGNNATLPTASGTASGVVTTGAQTWAGVKTFNNTITGSISGNAGTATTWATGRTIALTGDVTGTSGTFNGSANLSFATTLANSGVTAGTYRSVTVDVKGRVTAGTNPTTIAGYGITDAVTTFGDQTIAGVKTFSGTTIYSLLTGPATQTRDKIRVWSGAPYSIGMKNGYTYGPITGSDYAMSFQMNNSPSRGFWWGHDAQTDAQGAMALSTDGKLTIAHSVRIGYGESDVTVPGVTHRLDISGSANITSTLSLGTQASTTSHAVRADRSLTITGTTNQVTVSLTGAQNLTANRSWTLSLPQNIHTAATPTFGALTINGNLGIRAAASASVATQIPVFTADPATTTRTLVTRTPAQLRGDIGALSEVNLGITAGTTAGPIITNTAGTNATLPTASATASGVVTTAAQTWAGNKTFNNSVGIAVTPSSPLHIRGTGDVVRLDTSGAEDQDGVSLRFHQRDTTIGAGQGYGGIEWEGDDSGNPGVRGYIKGFSEGTTGQFGLRFATQESGASNPVERMRLDSSGRLGLGTTSPEQLLHIRGTNAGAKIQTTDTDSGGILFLSQSNNTGASIEYNGASDPEAFQIKTYASGTLMSTAMTIKLDGKVGIGTTSPGRALEVVSSGDSFFAVIQARSTSTSSYMQFTDSANSSYIGINNGNIVFLNPTTERARITSAGRLGLGTSSPDALLHLSSATGSASPTPTELRIATTTNASDWSTTDPWGRISFYSADTSGSGPKIHAAIVTRSTGSGGANSSFQFEVSDSTGALNTVMSLLPNGNVGIGTTNPGQALDVAGKIRAAVSVLAAGGIDTGNALTPHFSFSVDDDTGIFRAGGNELGFSTNGTERARIDSAGRVLIGTSSTRLARVGGANLSPDILLESETSATIAATRFVEAAAGSRLFLQKARGTQSALSIVVTGDNLGEIRFSGYDGSVLANAARIAGDSDGTPGAGDMPGRLTFSTTPVGSVTPTERMRIDSSGNVGIGTTSPATTLDVNGDVTITDKIIHGGNTNTAIRFPAADTVSVETGGSERARIDSSGRLLVGTSTGISTASNGGTSNAYIQSAATTNATGTIASSYFNNNVAGSSSFCLSKSRNTTIGNHTILNNNDRIGSFSFSGSDGTAFVEAARIQAEVDGTPGTNDMPGRLVFSTTADGASSPTERMRISNAGNVGIGTTNPLSTLHVNGLIRASTTATATTNTTGLISITNSNVNTGNVAIETTCISTATRHHISFVNPNGVVGSISTNASATAYNTSSDYRLKENVVPLSGAIDRLQQIPVHRFNFIADPDTVVDGFIAHEAQEIVPECVTGTKDEVDEDGNPVYQGIDQSKLVPLLTAALQEAIGRIETLEAKVAALEGA